MSDVPEDKRSLQNLYSTLHDKDGNINYDNLLIVASTLTKQKRQFQFGSSHVPNYMRPSQNDRNQIQNNRNQIQNNVPRYQNEGSLFQNSARPSTTVTVEPTIQSAAHVQGNVLPNYNNNKRTIHDPTYTTGQNFSTYHLGHREYLTSNIKEENEIFENASKRKRMIDRNILPSSSPYGQHSQVQTCICPRCSTSLPNFQSFMRHMESHIAQTYNNTLRVCPICKETSKDFESFTDHVFGHCIYQIHGISCIICKNKFDDLEQLQKHNQVFHVSTLFKCMLCSVILENRMSLQLHFLSKHNEEFHHSKCQLCPDVVFQDKISAKVHVSINHFNQYFPNSNSSGQCASTSQVREAGGAFPDCTLKFMSSFYWNQFNNYSAQMPRTTERPVEEIKTENLISDKPYTAENGQLGIEKNNFQCRLCKQIFSSVVKLQIHLIEHNFFGLNNYSCNLCSSVFASANELRSHMLEHGLQYRFHQCNHCQMKFFFRSELANHIVEHNSTQTTVNDQISKNNLDNITQYEACQYCHNIYLKSVFFNEHVKNCPLKPKINDVQKRELENNVKEDKIESMDTINKQ